MLRRTDSVPQAVISIDANCDDPLRRSRVSLLSPVFC